VLVAQAIHLVMEKVRELQGTKIHQRGWKEVLLRNMLPIVFPLSHSLFLGHDMK
jgi:hypothetical protein